MEKYRKSEIIKASRKHDLYLNLTEDMIESFSNVYDRFSTDIMDVADDFLIMIDGTAIAGVEDFYDIKTNKNALHVIE